MAKKKKKKGADDEEESGKGGKGKMIAIGAVVIGAVAAYRFVLAPAPAEEAVDGEPVVEEQAERVVEEGLILPMEEIVVNLADTTESRYLRIGMALVLEDGVAVEAVEPEAARAIDAAIDYLSGQTFDALREPGSKTIVRDELSVRIRAAFGDEKVVRVLLTTFVMQ